MIEKSVGESKAMNICEILNSQAPLTIRVNPTKIERDILFDKWRRFKGFQLKKTPYSPLGFSFIEEPHESLYTMKEFENGIFEIQDEASQLAAFQVDCIPGQQVLDYCAGAGGKTLAFGSMMQNTGQIYLHDIRAKALEKAKARIKKAGMGNCQFHVGDAKLKAFKGRFDWVMADVPCTGLGTLRRNPDLKYKISKDMLKHLTHLQQTIVNEAVEYLKPGGKLVYSTCSILNEENSDQIKYFVKQHGLEVEGGQQFISLPIKGGMDGFYACTLIKPK